MSGVVTPPRQMLRPHHSLVADNANLDGPAIFHGVNHSDDRIFRKVHVLDILIGLIEGRVTFQLDVLDFCRKARVFRAEQSAKDGVPIGKPGSDFRIFLGMLRKVPRPFADTRDHRSRYD